MRVITGARSLFVACIPTNDERNPLGGYRSRHRLGKRDERRGSAVAQIGGGNSHLHHPLPYRVEPVAARLRTRGDDSTQLGIDEVQRRAILGRIAGAHPGAQKVVVGTASARVALVVDAVAERQQAESLNRSWLTVEAGHRVGEPAERAGREPAEDDAPLPRFAQDRVDAVRPPNAEQADDAAAADVDQVLFEQMRTQVRGALLTAEERDVAGLAALGAKGPVEADDVVVGVAAGRGQEADLGPIGSGQVEHVVVEQRIARLHRKPPSPESDYLAQRPHAQMVALSRRNPLVQRSEFFGSTLARVYSARRCARYAARPGG